MHQNEIKYTGKANLDGLIVGIEGSLLEEYIVKTVIDNVHSTIEHIFDDSVYWMFDEKSPGKITIDMGEGIQVHNDRECIGAMFELSYSLNALVKAAIYQADDGVYSKEFINDLSNEFLRLSVLLTESLKNNE